MKKMQKTLLILFVLFQIVGMPLYVESLVQTKPPQQDQTFSPELLAPGTPGIPWTLKELLTDQSRSFASYSGKAVLIDFFATWCSPCEQLMPELKKIDEEYSSSKFALISIDSDPIRDTEAEIEAFAADKGMTWDIYLDTVGLSDDYEVASIPTLYLFDTDLSVHKTYSGVTAAGTVIKDINSLLGITSSPPPQTEPTQESEKGFWDRAWYWFLIITIIGIVATIVLVQRQRVIKHNKAVAEQKRKAKSRKAKRRRR